MINTLIKKIQETNAPIVVGLDPMMSYIPKYIQEKAFAEYGETLKGAAEACVSTMRVAVAMEPGV